MSDSILREILEVTRSILLELQAQRPAPDVAGDDDLDGPHGDPPVRQCPASWHGPDFRGHSLSRCPPAFLEQLALLLESWADRDDRQGCATPDGRPTSLNKRRNASRCRGWARRLEAAAAAKARANGAAPHMGEP